MTENELYEKLEYDKVLENIARNSRSPLTRKLILTHKPFNSIDEANNYGKLISTAKRLLEEDVHPPANIDEDLSEVISQSKIEGTALEPKKILRILDLLSTADEFKRFLNNYESIDLLKNKFYDAIYTDKYLIKFISSIIDKSGEVKDNASPRLREIRREKIEKNLHLKNLAEKKLRELSKAKITQEDFITLHDGRLVVPVRAEYKRQVRGLIHSESATGQTVYIEPEEILNLNNDIISLGFEEKREVRRLLSEITKRISTISNELLLTQRMLAEIEKIFLAAYYSQKYDCSFPALNNKSNLNLINAKHPILLEKLGEKQTIPLNLKFEDYKVIIITGPNAGGKTVVLKTVGLLSLLVKSGFHIPASPDSEFAFFDKIMIDIGDEQSIEENLSTFSSHLSNIKNILENADDKSLILLDEIGTGTDPTEGAALASAILLRLASKGSRVLATTHHGTLKVLANRTEGFQNASLEFDIENIRPTFRLKQGEPGASYAFEVANRIGLDDTLLNEAKKFIDETANKTEELLVELQKKADALSKKLREVELENVRLRGLGNLYESKRKQLEERKQKIIEEAKNKANEIIAEANKKIENAIREIRQSNAEKETIKKAKSEIEEFKKAIKPAEKPVEKREFKIGDFVRIVSSDTEGEIISIDKKKNKSLVQSGALKIEIGLDKLEHTKKRKNKYSLNGGNAYFTGLETLRLDIRGKKPEEIEYEVVKFIDDAYTTNNKEVEILHGKGSGVLKQTVHKLLKEHDFVKEFHFAKIEVGGEGITVVKLK